MTTSRPDSARTPEDATDSARPDAPLLSPVDLAAWGGFLAVHTRLMRRLDAHLVATHGMPLVEYEVLFTLHRAGGELRMAELASRAMLSRSGLTRIVDVLEAQRLVRRRPHPDDGRAVVAALTSVGRTRLQAARLTHSAKVRELLLDRLTTEQKVTLGSAWAAVLGGLDDDGAPGDPGAPGR